MFKYRLKRMWICYIGKKPHDGNFLQKLLSHLKPRIYYLTHFLASKTKYKNKKWRKCSSITDKKNSAFIHAENQSQPREKLKLLAGEGNVSFRTSWSLVFTSSSHSLQHFLKPSFSLWARLIY